MQPVSTANVDVLDILFWKLYSKCNCKIKKIKTLRRGQNPKEKDRIQSSQQSLLLIQASNQRSLVIGYINDDDLTFLPSIYKISVTENKKSDGIVKPIAIQTKLVENKNLTTTMTELRNILLSLPIPKSKGSLK